MAGAVIEGSGAGEPPQVSAANPLPNQPKTDDMPVEDKAVTKFNCTIGLEGNTLRINVGGEKISFGEEKAESLRDLLELYLKDRFCPIAIVPEQ